MTIAIKIENLSKQYLISHQRQERYTALRDVLMHKLRGATQRLRHPLSPNKVETHLEEFWALRDVNLEIKQGDRIGIIGRNGAGKSTLLKILSRITEPTRGRITIHGRVASLLEVGTGFHPELTGRENIFLNGAVLGMSRFDIKRKFDEIVAFAEVEQFLDTPVKRYSSGMYVRLAFAVAAHLEPEILVVDEVLAVGDAQFQKKCLGKMEDVSEQGRTVVFVSHNMQSVQRLCNVSALIQDGSIVDYGDVEKVVTAYLSELAELSINQAIPADFHQAPEPDLLIHRVELLDSRKNVVEHIFYDEQYRLRLFYKINIRDDRYVLGINFFTFDGSRVATASTRTKSKTICIDPEKEYIDVCIKNMFVPGHLTVQIVVKCGREYIDIIDGLRFSVLSVGRENNVDPGTGVVRLEEEWE